MKTIKIFVLMFALVHIIKINRENALSEKESFNYYRVDSVSSGSVFEQMCSLYASYGIRFAGIPVTQSYWETGGFSSTIFKENRNSFGMKYNSRGYATGINRGHAAYPNAIASLQDYAAWQSERIAAFERRFHPIKDEYDYINMLDSLVIGGKLYRYAEDPLYTQHIREQYNLLKKL